MKTKLLTFAALLSIQVQSCSPFTKEDNTNAQHSQNTEGQEMGNGIDHKPFESGSAWFLGDDRTVTYCYEVASSFGAEPALIDKTLDAVTKQWADYIAAKKINTTIPEWRPLNLATRFSRADHCDGHEDLKIYFGVSNQEVDTARTIDALINPIAFAHRNSYDAARGWSKGFLWVTPTGRLKPNWFLAPTLHGVLLHELGHVFGNGHSDNTIMDELGVDVDLSTASGRGDTPSDPGHMRKAKARLSNIDFQHELVLCPNCAFKYRGFLGAHDYLEFLNANDDSPASEQARLFKLITGRDPVGTIQATLRQPEQTDTTYNGIELLVADDTSEVIAPISIDPSSVTHQSSYTGAVFKRYMRTPDKSFWTSASNKDSTIFGSLTPATGTPLNIVLERNMREPMKLSYILEGKKHPLFSPKALF